jgi:hypothetical protein
MNNLGGARNQRQQPEALHSFHYRCMQKKKADSVAGVFSSKIFAQGIGWVGFAVG